MIWFKLNDIHVIESEIIVRKIQLNINEAEKFLNKNTLTILTFFPIMPRPFVLCMQAVCMLVIVMTLE
jgi:hypothetical protein